MSVYVCRIVCISSYLHNCMIQNGKSCLITSALICLIACSAYSYHYGQRWDTAVHISCFYLLDCRPFPLVILSSSICLLLFLTSSFNDPYNNAPPLLTATGRNKSLILIGGLQDLEMLNKR